MKAIKDMKHFPIAEQLVDILTKKTQNPNPLFFRVLVAYYMAKITSMMRIGVNTHDRGTIPVSLYAINLSVSGSGKGFSTNIVEEQVINQFRERFLEETFPLAAEKNVTKIAIKRAVKYQEDEEDMIERVRKEFEDLGPLAFSFDSGTTAAVKQMRHKLLMANAGSVNLEIDEIGSNLLGNVEVLNTFLELFDIGKIKQKLIKNTADNKRSEDIDGRTPTNMMLFGTPAKLLNGGKVEDEFYSFLETGYARRCFFGYNKKVEIDRKKTAQEVYDMMTDKTAETFLKKLSSQLGRLADPINFGRNLSISKNVSLQLIEYKLMCEERVEQMREHEEISKAEMMHRYYKVLKLAGAYAFIDGAKEVTEDHLHHAIKLAEESGSAFKRILSRERNYVKLANYIADVGHEVTQVDLVEDLPFYRGAEAQKRDMMNLAIAYGYKNNIIIKKSYSDGIEFLQGESLEVTDLHKMRISYSDKITEGYLCDVAPFAELYKLVTMEGYHYTAHHFENGYRNSENLIEGFNLLILDVDSGTNLQTAQSLMSDYKALFATTKRHTDRSNRFRIILPLSHMVKLDAKQYAKFMENVFNWLPFEVDRSTKDCARKWETYPGTHLYQDGQLLDATLFIPQTRKEEEQRKVLMDQSSLNNLERWFYQHTDVGNRSNQLIRYALVLVDNGFSIEQVRTAVLNFNDKLKDNLTEKEINDTIMVTVVKNITKRDM